MPEKKHEPAKQEKQHGSMTVEEAGRLGGHKGGQRERELVEKGHQVEEQKQSGQTSSGQKGKH
ncbi:MAG: hypothetical protein IPM54_44665 [Polyangiaceae bacterium]|nr:hypothetical protein [Polyangiaceae bacterium]